MFFELQHEAIVISLMFDEVISRLKKNNFKLNEKLELTIFEFNVSELYLLSIRCYTINRDLAVL